MGNTLGKANIKDEALPFINLPGSLIYDLRQNVYEVAEGLGLTLEEFKKIIRLCLQEFLSIPDANIDECSEALFRIFNDNSGSSPDKGKHPSLVDSFEVIGTLCLASGMELDEKINFLFSLFDFNETEDLNVNEMTLALRTIVGGASKIRCSAFTIDLEFIDRVAIESFGTLSSKKSSMSLSVALSDDEKISRQEFFNFIYDCAETKAFLDHFNDLKSAGVVKNDNLTIRPKPLRFSSTQNDNRKTDGPWRDQIRFLKPQQHEKYNASPPAVSLSLDWIYGRNTQGPEVLYGADGSMFYPAGTMVVKLTADRSDQHYFTQHSGHVTSIDIMQCQDSCGEMMASADVGEEPKICIWSTDDLTLPQITIPSFHRDGASKLKFSPSTNLLLTLGNDTHTVAIHHWRTRSLVFTANVPAIDVYDCNFLGSDDRFGVCGNNDVHFWTRFDANQQYTHSHGVFQRLSTQETMTCIAHVNTRVATGSSSGRIWLWEGRVCTKMLAAVHSPITCLTVLNGDHLCVSTRQGMVYLFNEKFEVAKRFNVGPGSIDSLCCNPKLGKILIGQGNHIVEASVEEPTANISLILGHNEVKCFTPLNGNTLASISDGGTLMLWDTTQYKVLDEVCFDLKLSCISYNEASNHIAIGLATGHETSLASKSFIIVDRSDLKNVLHSGCNAQNTVLTCQYSIDGQFLAFGSEDCGIYIHLCTEKGFPLISKCRGHTGPVSSLDFGTNNGSTFLRSNSIEAGEVCFWRTDGKVQTPMSQRQTKWESQSCTLCWTLESVHKDVAVASCCLTPSNNDSQPSTLFVGDSKGIIRVFSHPVDSNPSLTYKGHSGEVLSMACLIDGSFIFSLGSACLFQWKSTAIDWKASPLEMISDSSKAAPIDMNDTIIQLDDLDFSKKSAPVKIAPRKRSMPWKRAIVSPTNPPTINNELPHDTLILEKVHGYHGNGRDNLHYMSQSENEIVYSVGKVLARLNVGDSKQQFYIADGNIVWLTLHQPTFRCAIASNNGLVHVVDVDKMKLCQRLQIEALQMDFDHTGRYLAVLSHGTISLIDWQNQVVVASSQTFSSGALIKFYKDSIVECNSDFIRLWTLRSSEGCMHFEEITCDEVNNKTFSCVAVEGDHMFLGCSSGSLLKFTDKHLQNKRIKAHESALTCISATKEGIVTGSVDGFLKVWSLEMRCLCSINAREAGISHCFSAVTYLRQTITIGTNKGEIHQITADGSRRSVTQSHSPGGLSINPTGFAFVSTGDDGLLRHWNIFDFECTTFDIKMPSRACAYSPDGRLIAVGMGKPEKENAHAIIDGKWIIINNDGSNQILAERRDSRKCITNIEWSGSRIAVASNDCTVCVYDVSSTTKPAVKVQISVMSVIELQFPATHFDFSRDSKYLRLNTADAQVSFYEAGPAVHIKESSRLKDIVWDTETSIYSWSVQGIWSPFDDGCEVLSLDTNDHNNVSSLVCGHADGCLKLYRHPCTLYQAQYIKYAAHAGSVRYVRWTPGGSHLISTGESDKAIMIWKHQVGYADDDHVYIQESSPKSLQDDLFIPNCTETDRVDDCVVSNEMATLVHAQGYQSNFIGQSVFYDCNGRVIYPASNLLVSCDPKTSSQRFFEQHETISAICTSGDKQLVASASNNSIRIWDTSTHQAISLLPLPVEGKISFLTFSPDNNKIASISRDDHGNYTSIYATLTGNWIDGFLESTSLAGHNHVYFALFTCFDSRPNYFVVGGSSHLNFWTHHQSSLVPSHQHVEDVHICGVQIGENVVTGTKSGRLVFWNDKKISGEVNAHERSVLALCRCPEGLLSASSDGMVIMWCNGRKKLGSFDVSTSFESPYHKALCSLDAFPSITGERTAKILVGTRSSKIYEVSCTTGCITAVTDFHEYGDVRAASFDPNNQDQFATVGSDNFIKIWSLQNNQVVAQAQVSKFPLRCVDWSNNGMILVGCDTKNEKSGVPYTFMLLNSSDLSLVGTGKASDHSITAVRFSPDGRVFACAASNFKIYIHEMPSKEETNFKLLSVAEKHNGIVTGVDFSVDSMYFQGISSSGEYIAYNTETGEPSREDIEWATNTCMHKLVVDSKSQPTCSQLSADGRLLFVGMSSGSIEVTQLQDEKMEKLTRETYQAHCGPVAKVVWSNDGNRLITIGLNDRTTRIWSITPDFLS